MDTSRQSSGVAITGVGAICGLGHNLQDVWKSLLAGQSGISKITHYPAEQLPIPFAGEIKNFSISEELISAKEQPRYDKFIHYSIHSAHEAYQQSLNGKANPYPLGRVGCILGVGMGGFPIIEDTHLNFLSKGARRVSPFFIPSIIPNMAPGLICLRFGLKGANFTISSACASSIHAIHVAAQEILTGRQDMVITGGAEGIISNLAISGFASMKALSKRIGDPKKASRPFDQDRDGFVIGEGAGVLVLEDLAKAKKRGAKILATLIGSGISSDAYHITAPHPEGEGAIQCMEQAIASSGIRPEEIGYVNAHGTSTPLGDIAETKAIKKVFGDYAKRLLISSTKSSTGHLLGAAGGIESVFCVMALLEGQLPPTINLDNPDPECDLNYIPHQTLKAQVQYALNNSFGFGGTNASLVFKRF